MALPWVVLLALVAAVLLDLRDLHALPDRVPDATTALWGYGVAGWGPPRPPPDTREAPLRVVLLGASSIVFPTPEQLVDPLRERLDALSHPARIDDLGVPGMSTGPVVSRGLEVLEDPEPPSVLVVYAGHNDASFGVQDTLLQPFAPARATRVLWWVRSRPPPTPKQFPLFHRIRLEGLVDAAQDLGWGDLPEEAFVPMHEAVADYGRRNLTALADAAREKGVPLILATPISNLEWMPHGPSRATRERWETGLAETDPVRRRALLREARDGDLFGSDLRADTTYLAMLRSLAAGPGVHLCDVEARLDAEGFDYGPRWFTDQVHFTAEGHAVLARHLADCIDEVLGPSAEGVDEGTTGDAALDR